eukprot:COSAG01_NODE_6718_length_3530_cov_5.092101_3_plen_114_part_00
MSVAGIEMVSVAMSLPGGQQAATMRVAEAYVRSFGEAWAPQTPPHPAPSLLSATMITTLHFSPTQDEDTTNRCSSRSDGLSALMHARTHARADACMHATAPRPCTAVCAADRR